MPIFYPGQRVICVDDGFHPGIVEWANHTPQQGQVYTVKIVRSRARHRLTAVPGVGLVLQELPNPYDRISFSAHRFVPADSSVTHVEALKTSPHPIAH